jgi:hypothetical protein
MNHSVIVSLLKCDTIWQCFSATEVLKSLMMVSACNKTFLSFDAAFQVMQSLNGSVIKGNMGQESCLG